MHRRLQSVLLCAASLLLYLFFFFVNKFGFPAFPRSVRSVRKVTQKWAVLANYTDSHTKGGCSKAKLSNWAPCASMERKPSCTHAQKRQDLPSRDQGSGAIKRRWVEGRNVKKKWKKVCKIGPCWQACSASTRLATAVPLSCSDFLHFWAQFYFFRMSALPVVGVDKVA